MFEASHLTRRVLLTASLVIASALYVACDSDTDVDSAVSGFPDAGSCFFSGAADPTGSSCTTGTTCDFSLQTGVACTSGSGPCTCPNGSWQCTISLSKLSTCDDSGAPEEGGASDASADAHD